MSAIPPPVSLVVELLRQGNLLEVCGRAAARTGLGPAGYREDGAVLLADSASEWLPTRPPSGAARRPESAVREVHLLTPTEDRVRDLRARYPGAWLHGAAEEGLDREGARRLAEAGLDSLGVATGPAEEGAGPWETLLDLPLPLVASALYGPGTPPEALAARLERLAGVPGLAVLVWLPLHPGDLVEVPGQTTDGTDDALLLAVSRLVLPARVRVRSSWAAYGWKMAQFALALGVDEVAGWGLEEQRAWRGAHEPADLQAGPEPAARLGREEAQAGVIEARRQPREVRGCAWES